MGRGGTRGRLAGRAIALADPSLLEGRCPSGGFRCLRLLLSHCESAADEQRGADQDEVPHGRLLRLHRPGGETVLQMATPFVLSGSPASAHAAGHRAAFDAAAWPDSVG